MNLCQEHWIKFGFFLFVYVSSNALRIDGSVWKAWKTMGVYIGIILVLEVVCEVLITGIKP